MNYNVGISYNTLFNFAIGDVNKINIINSDIRLKQPIYITSSNNDLFDVDFNFYNSHITLYSNMDASKFIQYSTYISGMKISDLNLISYNDPMYPNLTPSLISVYFNNSSDDLNYLILENVVISDFNNGIISDFSETLSNRYFDFNIINSDLNLYNSEYGIYANADYTFNHFNMNIEDSNVYGLKLQRLSNEDTTNPIITITSSNIVDMNIEDSNFTLDSLFDITDSNVTGLIYNNLFKDMNLDNDFILSSNSDLDFDFNSSLASNTNKRHIVIPNDDIVYVGGNLWVNSDGNNLCPEDTVEPIGICDSAINVLGTSFYDYLPLSVYWSREIRRSGGGSTTKFDLYPVATVYGDLQADESADVQMKVYKTGKKSVSSATLKLYLIDGSNKIEYLSRILKNLDSQDYIENVRIPFSSIVALVPDIYDYLDSTGSLTFSLEVSASGESNTRNNISQKKMKLILFDGRITNIKLNEEGKETDLNRDSNYEMNVEKNYTLTYDVEQLQINKIGNISQNRNLMNFGLTQEPLSEPLQIPQKQKSTTSFDINFNLSDLVSESELDSVIVRSLDLNIGKSEDNLRLQTIKQKLLQNNLSESYFDLRDAILLLSSSKDVTVEISGDDYSTNNKLDLEMIFFDETKECKNCGDGDGGIDSNIPDTNNIDLNKLDKDSKDKNKLKDQNDVSELVYGNYILSYKSKLGLGEEQIIIVYDKNKTPQTDKEIIITYSDSNWKYSSDENGKVLFMPIYEGKYELAMKYDGEYIFGEFEVIAGYVSSNSDYVEVLSNKRTSGISSTTKTTLLVSGAVIVLIGLGVLLYLFFIKPKPDTPYEFKPLN